MTEALGLEIEADGYAPDASSAIEKAKVLLGLKKGSLLLIHSRR